MSKTLSQIIWIISQKISDIIILCHLFWLPITLSSKELMFSKKKKKLEKESVYYVIDMKSLLNLHCKKKKSSTFKMEINSLLLVKL